MLLLQITVVSNEKGHAILKSISLCLNFVLFFSIYKASAGGNGVD